MSGSRVSLTAVTDDLVADLAGLTFGPPVTCVYNPMVYARKAWDLYCDKYGQGQREVLLLGMNPGPWGMAQTGIPFGEIDSARDWLGVEAAVDKPPVEHPKRPIEGFRCKRSEVSGRRIWGWARRLYGEPEAFFGRFFIANYCPLVFMEESGRNRTPDKLPAHEREPLFAACDRGLRDTVAALGVHRVIGVGVFAEGRAKAALADMDVTVGRILHPSPASPKANRGWAEAATSELAAQGITVP